MVGVFSICAQVDLHPVHAAGENARLAGVIIADWRCSVASDIRRLVAGEHQRHGGADASLALLVAVDKELHRTALRRSTAVIGELHAHLVHARRDGRRAFDLEAL